MVIKRRFNYFMSRGHEEAIDAFNTFVCLGEESENHGLLVAKFAS